MMSVILTAVNGTGDQLARYVEYGSFFAVPVVLAFISRALSPRLSVALVVIPFFLLSLPTFLAFHGQIGISSYYPEERRAGEFLWAQHEDASDDLQLFTSIRDMHHYLYYFPTSQLHTSIFGSLKRSDKEMIWEDADLLVTDFMFRPGPGPPPKKVFIFSEAFPATYQHLFGILPEDPRWLEISTRLETTNVFYDNGLVQMYSQPP